MTSPSRYVVYSPPPPISVQKRKSENRKPPLTGLNSEKGGPGDPGPLLRRRKTAGDEAGAAHILHGGDIGRGEGGERLGATEGLAPASPLGPLQRGRAHLLSPYTNPERLRTSRPIWRRSYGVVW